MNMRLMLAIVMAAALAAPALSFAQQQGDATQTEEPNPLVAPGGPVVKPGPETYPPKTGPRSSGEMMEKSGEKAEGEMMEHEGEEMKDKMKK